MDSVLHLLAIDENDDVLSQCVLIIQNVTPRSWIFLEEDVQHFADGASFHVPRRTVNVSLQILGEDNVRHGNKNRRACPWARR